MGAHVYDKVAPVAKRRVTSWRLLIVAVAVLVATTAMIMMMLDLTHVDDRSSSMLECPFESLPSDLSGVQRIQESRRRLADELVAATGGNASVHIILATAPRPSRPGSDMELPGYRQSSNVFYLVGPMQIAGALVVATLPPASIRANHTTVGSDTIDASVFRITVFLPVVDRRTAIFSGAPPDPEALRRDLHVDAVLPMRAAPAALAGMPLFAADAADPPVIAAILGSITADKLAESGTSITYSPIIDNAFRTARQVKTPAELRLLTHASRIAAWAHNHVERILTDSVDPSKSSSSFLEMIMSSLRLFMLRTTDTPPLISQAAVSESSIASLFVHLCTLCGARLQAYSPIVASGPHAAILHFPTGETLDEGMSAISSGQFVLIDAAGEYRGYASDITRTHPRNGIWTPSMRLIHNIVAAAQSDAIDAFDVNVPWSAVIAASTVSLTKHMIDAGILIGDLDTLLLSGIAFTFMPHGLGHRIGLDVHDPIPLSNLSISSHLDGGFDTDSVSVASVRREDRRVSGIDAFVNAMRVYGIGVLQLSTHSTDIYVTSTAGVDASSHGHLVDDGDTSTRHLLIHKWMTEFNDFEIVPGSVMTIEPGLYFIRLLLDAARGDPSLSMMVDWSRVSDLGLVDVGGVRIEDVVMVDGDGRKSIISRI